MPTYSLYGISFASDLQFHAPLPTGHEATMLEVTSGPDLPPGDWSRAELLYDSPFRDELAHPVVTLYRCPAGYRLHFPRAADFFLTRDRIHVRPLPHGDRAMVEIYLLGTVFSWWREAYGVPMLHAAAVAVQGGAVGFLASNQGGKSSLAATLVQSGDELLTDDLLAVEPVRGGWVGHAGYPQMRMWPDQAACFAGGVDALEAVHPLISKLLVPIHQLGGSFHPGSLPLRALYLPERRMDREDGLDVRIASASPRRRLIELVRHSFLARMVEAAGLQPRRLTLLARLASEVPVRTLSYPSGVVYLPSIAAAVWEDLQRLGASQADG